MSAIPPPKPADLEVEDVSGVPVRRSTLGLRSVRALELLGRERELLIEHGNVYYRLRITKNDKLILTK